MTKDSLAKKIELDPKLAKIKANSKAALGSREKAKDIIDSINLFMQAIADNIGVDEWFSQNIGFLAYARVGDKFQDEAEKKKAEDMGKELQEGMLMCRGSGGVLLDMIVRMLSTMAEHDAEKMRASNFIFSLIDKEAPDEVKQTAIEMSEDVAKLKIIQEVATRMGVTEKVKKNLI